MRTMLKLILLCSLAQFAIAQAGPKIPIPDNCKNQFACFAPDYCVSPSNYATIQESSVVRLRTVIIDNCPALIKFYEYAKNWVHVSIESLDQNVQSVIFIQNDKRNVLKNKFTCTKSNGIWEGFRNNKKQNPIDTQIAKERCEFEVKLGSSVGVINQDNTDYLFFELEGGLTTDRTIKSSLGLDAHCDPSNLNFDKNDPIKKNSVYMKVQYKLDEVFCEYPAISKLQYRVLPAPADYTDATSQKFICENELYQDVATQLEEYMDARCIADVNYFCDYDPKKPTTLEPSQEKLKLKPPQKETKVAAELKCPPTHPHLFISGKPVFKEGTRTAPEIECNNYGGTPLWAVNGIRLTKTGPVAYCSDKLVCKDLYKIQQSSVLRGRLNTDDKPECFAGGKLQEHSGTKLEASNFRCDESTGEFKYDAGGVAKKVEEMKFECIYPPPVDITEKNAENRKTLAIGVTASGIGVGIITLALFFGFLWFARWSYRRERKRQEAAEKAAYDLFTMKKKEREMLMQQKIKDREEAKKNAKATPSSSSEGEGRKMWSNKIMAGLSNRMDFARVKPETVGPNKFSSDKAPNSHTAEGDKDRADYRIVNDREILGRTERKYLKVKATGYEKKE